MASLILVTAVFGLFLSIGVMWANPTRFTNQALSASSFLMLCSLLASYGAFKAGVAYETDNVSSPIPWIRAAAAISGFLPWSLWILKESLLPKNYKICKIIIRSYPWFLVGITLAIICFTEWYIPADSTPADQKRGAGYVIRNAILIATITVLVVQSVFQMRAQRGIRRIELKFFVVNLGVAMTFCISLTYLSSVLQKPLLRTLSIFFIFVSYVLVSWAVAAHKIFDLKQILPSFIQRVAIIFFLGFSIFFHAEALAKILHPTISLFISAAFCGSVTLWLDLKSRAWLDINGEQALTKARRSAIETALNETDPEDLILAFRSSLCEEAKTRYSCLLVNQGGRFQCPELVLTKQQPALTALCEIGWATPESLERRRKNSALEALHRLMSLNHLGLVISSPAGSENPSLLAVFGTKTELWPFTYPEIQRLQNITELMDNILTRSRLTAQAALEARVEHLAIMSRGLAHDLKNLITPVSSFLIHTDNHFPPDSAEGEVHSAARRSVRIMTDYVREALFFSERLSPTFALIDFSKLFQTVHDVVDSRADRRGVEVLMKATANLQLTADTVLMQRVLGNLVNNAIDASRAGQSVKISVSDLNPEIVRFEVKDAGCGIATECLSRIFDPYFTTKEFGHDVRGFGLGLTICQKIVQLHSGAISVESQLGQGTRVFVDLPRNPPEGGTAKRAP